jgi:hypothetical protein
VGGGVYKGVGKWFAKRRIRHQSAEPRALLLLLGENRQLMWP